MSKPKYYDQYIKARTGTDTMILPRLASNLRHSLEMRMKSNPSKKVINDDPLKTFLLGHANNALKIALKRQAEAPMNPITDPELRSEFGDTNPDAITAPSLSNITGQMNSSNALSLLKKNFALASAFSQQKQKAYTEASNAELAARTNRESDVNNKLRKQMLLKLLTGSTLQGKTLLGA